MTEKLSLEEWNQIQKQLFCFIVDNSFTASDYLFAETAIIIFEDIRDNCPYELNSVLNICWMLGFFSRM